MRLYKFHNLNIYSYLQNNYMQLTSKILFRHWTTSLRNHVRYACADRVSNCKQGSELFSRSSLRRSAKGE